MTFDLRPIGDDKWEIVFSGQPDYIHALPMVPDAMESDLRTGVWLVLTFPVWSAPAYHSVLAAVASVKELGGKVQLGVRPFDSHKEVVKWWPLREAPPADEELISVDLPRGDVDIAKDYSGLPLWLVLRNGQIVRQTRGLRSKEQVGELMREVVPLS